MVRNSELQFQMNQAEMLESLKRALTLILEGKLSQSEKIQRIQAEISEKPVEKDEIIESPEKMTEVVEEEVISPAEPISHNSNWIHVSDCFKPDIM